MYRCAALKEKHYEREHISRRFGLVGEKKISETGVGGKVKEGEWTGASGVDGPGGLRGMGARVRQMGYFPDKFVSAGDLSLT